LQANQNCSPNSRGYGVDDEDDDDESDESSGGRGARGERGVDLSEDLDEELDEDLDEEEDEEEEGEDTDSDTENEELDDEEEDDDEEEEEEDEDEEKEEEDEDEDDDSEKGGISLKKGGQGSKPVVPLSPGGREATAFRLQFLGSVEVEEEGKKHRKRLKKNMVEEAVSRVKVCGLIRL